MAEGAQPHPRTTGNLLNIALRESPQDREGGIIPNQSIPRQDARYELDRIVRNRMPSQVIDDKCQPRYTVKVSDHTCCLMIFEMMEEERCQDKIEAGIIERQIVGVRANNTDLGITGGLRASLPNDDFIKVQHDEIELDPT